MYALDEILSANLKRLRRSRDLTQEEAASALGVVPQTVSKWERGETCPDLALLPQIATYYGVSLDELMGMSEYASAERRTEMLDLGQQHMFRAEYGKAVEVLREALRVFPGDAEIKLRLAEVLNGADPEPYTNPDSSYWEEAAAILETLIHDPVVGKAARFQLMMLYAASGRETEREKAEALLKEVPRIQESREFVRLMFARSPEESVTAHNELLFELFNAFVNRLSGTSVESKEVNISRLRAALNIVNVVLDERDLDCCISMVFEPIYRNLTWNYIALGEFDAAIDAVEQLVKWTLRENELADPNLPGTEITRPFASPVFRGLDNDIVVMSNALEILGDSMEYFAAELGENPRFQALLERLSPNSPAGQ